MSKRSMALAVCVLFLALGLSAQAMEGFIGLTNGYFYNKTTGEPWVPHGIAYQTWNRPLGVWQTKEQIEYDLDEMVKMGANSVRIDMVWQHVEEDGDNQFKWTNYDNFVQACEDRNLRIFALIGYQWPPNWFPDEWYTMHPPATDSEGIFHTNRWQSDIINYEHPQARAQYAEWLAAVAGHFKDKKAIVGWIVGNESGYLGLWSGLLDGYDPETEAAFRTWTSNKYSTIEAVNSAWGTDFESFEAITFVEEYRAYGPDGAEWADMVQFREDSIGSFTAVGALGAKSADTNHLISYSTVGMQWGEEDWRYHAEDRGKITAACAATNAPIDFFSVNNYPWSILGHESQNGQWGISYTKKVANVPVVYSETGFTSSETMWPGMDEYRQGPLVRNALWESLEAGAIGTHIFSWMDRPYITDREKGFGILYADRRIKPAFWVSRDTFTEMDQIDIHALLMGSKDPRPDIAFLWTAANDSQYNRYECEMQQMAGALERLGYEPNFMDLQDLANGAYTNYSVLILPRNMRVEDAVPGYTNSVLNFIENYVLPAGVHVIASADLPGMQNANGKPREAFEGEVESLFGIDASNISGEEAPQRAGVYVSWNWRPLDIAFTTNAAGRVANGYTYSGQGWKYSDEIKVTDGTLWATMDNQRNKGFEDSNDSFTGWDGTWGDAYVRSGWGWAYEGNNMVQMWGDSGIWDDLWAVPYGRYEHTAYLRSNSDDPLRGGVYACTMLEWYDKNDVLIGTAQSVPLAGSTPDSSWVEYTVNATAPANTWKARRITSIKTASQNLLNNGALSGSGDAPDNWSNWNNGSHDPDTATYLSAGNSWVFWYDGGIYQDIESGFNAGDTLLVGGYLYTPGDDVSPTLSNGGFESDAHGTMPPSSWTKTGNGATWVQTIGFSSAGTNCVKFYQGYNSQTTTLYQSLSAAEGQVWTATAKIYDWSSSGNPLSAGDEAFIRLDWVSSSGSNIGSSVTSSKITTSSGQDSWHSVSASGTAPSGAVSARMVLALSAGPNNDVVVFFDEATLSRTVSSDSLRNGTKYGVIDVEFYDQDSTLLTESASPVINADSRKAEWLYAETETTVPAGTDRIRVTVRCNDYNSGDGRFMADDLFAVNLSHFPNLLGNPGLDGTGDAPTGWSQWNDGSHDPETTGRSDDSSWAFWWDGGLFRDVSNGFKAGDTLQFGGYLYTPDPDAPAECLLNAGFEDDPHNDTDPDHWTKSGSGAIWVQTIGFASEGTNTCKIYQGWNSQSTKVYQDVTAVESDTWIASAKFYDWSSSGNPMESGDEAYVTIAWLDANGSNVGTSVDSDKITSSSGQDAWHTASVTGSAPAGAVSARLLVTLTAGASNNVVIFVDDASLKKEAALSSDPLRNGTKYGMVQLELYNGETLLSTVSAVPTINSNSVPNQWLRVTGSVDTPTNTTKARIIVRCNDSSSGDGRFLADDLFIRDQTPGGSVYVDGNSLAPALVVKDHGAGHGKAAIFLYSVGDNNPDSNGDGDMDVGPWKYRYDVFGALIQDYFGIEPSISAGGSNAYLCLPEYRTCSNGMTLLQVKNYLYETNLANGGPDQTFTLTSDLFAGKTIEALGAASVIEQDSDGTIDLTLAPDGMEMLLVYENSAVNQLVHIIDVPSLVHPFGDKAYQVSVRYDCLDTSDLTLKIAFCEKDDNGDGVSNEIYQVVESPVSGSGLYTNYIWIPDPDTADTDYLSTEDGGEYVFRAWLENSNGVSVAEAVPQAVQLKWGVSPTTSFPEVMEKGDQVSVGIEWEDLYEYLAWENTPLSRSSAFADRVAVFRSSKTETMVGGHFDRVNAVCDWLESMGYENGEQLDISFDNLTVEGIYLEDFNDGVADGISRDAGCGNWTAENGVLRAWRIGNDDNICSFGDTEWGDYTASVDIKYNQQGHYFNDAELYVRYQDRNNFVKVGIRNYYGAWRLKYTVRSETNNVDQNWIHYFTKENRPVEGEWYTLKVAAEGAKYTVYFTDTNGEAEVGSFYDGHFLTGKVAVGSKATQLGIWDPENGYYFIDDDEYSYYSADEAESVTCGYPLNLDWGYLQTFYPTLILPGTLVMSDSEVDNIQTWFTNGLHCLIATDGGAAMLDEYGSNGLGRIESLFGMNGAVSPLTNLQQLTIGAADHYVTLDYEADDTVPLTGNAYAWTSVDSGTALAVMDNGQVSVPALVVHVNTNDALSPKKALCFNFGVDTLGQLTNQVATLAQRAFEWARGEAYKVRLELKCQVDPDDAGKDITVAYQEGWLLTSSGTNTLVVHIPEENVITGSNMYWTIYVYPWDSTNAWVSHSGFFTSANDDDGSGVYSDLAGAGLQMLGITDVAYSGRDWDMWVAYNTRGQDMVVTYGLKDKGDLYIEDMFNDGSLTGWTVYPSGNSRWTEPDGVLQAAAPASAGYTWILRNSPDVTDKNITVEYDVLYDAYTTQGGFVYRGQILNLNPYGIWWTTNAPVPSTNSGTIGIYIGPDGLSTGVWHHIAVSIRDGEDAPVSDVYVDGEPQYVNVPLAGTNFDYTAVGFLSTYSNGVMKVDNFRVVDEQYSMVSTVVNGFFAPTNAAQPTFWATAPDYDYNKWEYEGTTLGGTQEFYAYLRGTNLSVAQETKLYFGARLMVENAAFPTNMDKGETVSVPVEWENLPEETMRLHVALVYPYQTAYQDAGDYAWADFTIHGATSNGWFEITVPNSTPAGSFYLWSAYVYPTNAADPYTERVSLDDTFHFGTNGPSIIWYPREHIISVSSTVAETDDLKVYSDAGTPEDTDVLVWGADYYATVTSSSLNDGGFEESTGNGTFPDSGYWLPSSSGGGSYAICTTTAARSDTNGLWAYTGSDSWANWVAPYEDYYAVEGDLYRVQAYIRQPTGESGPWVSGAQAYVRMKFLNALSNEISYVDSAVKVTSEDQGWTLCSITNAGVAPAGTAYMRIELFVERPSTTTGVAVANFDDIYVGMGNSFYGNYTGEGESTPEGSKCFRSSVVHWSGWGVFFSTNTYPQGANLSDYTGGYLKFWLKTPGYTRVELKDINGTVQGYPSNTTWMNPTTNALGQVVWQEKSIPLSFFSNIDFTHIVSPFMGTDPIENEAFEFLIDDVRWTLEE